MTAKKVAKPPVVNERMRKRGPRVISPSKVQMRVPEVEKPRSRGWKRGLVFAIVAGVVMILGAVTGWILANQEPPVEDEIAIIEEPEEEESPEAKYPKVNEDPLIPEPEILDWTLYEVAPYKPRYLSIPAIGLENVPIIEFGISETGQMGAPVNIHVVGWYYRSAFPGQEGTSIMDAHGGDLGDGIFRALPQAPIGAEIIIEMGDGRKVTYTIAEKVYKPIGIEADWYMGRDAYWSPEEGVPSLTLITCTGAWIPAKQTYDQRLFVRALLNE